MWIYEIGKFGMYLESVDQGKSLFLQVNGNYRALLYLFSILFIYITLGLTIRPGSTAFHLEERITLRGHQEGGAFLEILHLGGVPV